MVESLPPLYTTEAEMDALFSSLGITLRLDDDDDGTVDVTEQTYLEDAIVDATDFCNQYLLGLYNASDLIESRWVRRRATWLACCYLSRRRGNAKQFSEEVERITKELYDIERGRRFVPRLAPAHNVAPAASNLVVDWRYRESQLRVDPTQGAGGSHSEQHVDDGDFYWG